MSRTNEEIVETWLKNNLLPVHQAVELPPPAREAPALIPLSEVEPVAPEYLWEPYLRAGQLNILRGDGGAGKTMLAFAIAAAYLKGENAPGMPGILHSGGGRVLYLGREDEPGEYAMRARNTGCDLERLLICVDAAKFPTFRDVALLKDLIQEAQARLVIFDPLQSFLGAGVDMNRANEVRPLLDNLRNLAREQGVTVMILEHLSKATQQSAVYRGIGSVDMTNASRSVLLVGLHPDEEGVRVACHIKANAAYGQTVRFEIDQQGRFVWRGACDLDAERVCAARHGVFKAPQAEEYAIQAVRRCAQENPLGWQGTASRLMAQYGAKIVDAAMPSRSDELSKRVKALGAAGVFASMGVLVAQTKGRIQIAKAPGVMIL